MGTCPNAQAQATESRVTGITFDTGMLIALEKHKPRANEVFQRAHERRVPMIVPTAVIAEWWRGRSDVRDGILAAVFVEPMTERISKAAGEAIGSVRGATVVDAIVMASAAATSGLVYSADVDDLTRLQRFFPAVRILSV